MARGWEAEWLGGLSGWDAAVEAAGERAAGRPLRAPLPPHAGDRADRRVGDQPGLRRRVAAGQQAGVPGSGLAMADRGRTARRGRGRTGGLPGSRRHPARHPRVPDGVHAHVRQPGAHLRLRGELRLALPEPLARQTGRPAAGRAVRGQRHGPRVLWLPGRQAHLPVRPASRVRGHPGRGLRPGRSADGWGAPGRPLQTQPVRPRPL